MLPAFDGCASAVARASAVSSRVVQRAAHDPEIVAMAGITKAQLAQGFANLTQKLLQHYDGMVADANLDNKGTTLLGIVADKALLYANEPTVITQNHHEVRAVAEKTLAEYREQFGARALDYFREDAPLLAEALGDAPASELVQ